VKSLTEIMEDKGVSLKDKAYIFARYCDTYVGDAAPQPEVQYRWDKKRTRRASDFAFPQQKLLVEIDGGTKQVFHGRKGSVVGGSHNSDADRDRSNDAAVYGYRFNRFTPEKLTSDPIVCLNTVLASIGVPALELE
jgi:very-short-patch-repair endonuclease